MTKENSKEFSFLLYKSIHNRLGVLMLENLKNEMLNTVISDLAKKVIDLADSQKKDNDYVIGKVVNNNDSKKKFRVQVRVTGYHDSLSDDDLPWAIQDQQFHGVGSVNIPEEGSFIKVLFDNDDPLLPVYQGQIVKSDDSFDSNPDEDYPDTVVLFETTKGDYCKINKKTNTFIFRHSSGLLLSIDADGNLEVESTLTESGNITVNTGGSVSVNCGGDAEVISTGNTTLQSATLEVKTPDGALWKPNSIPNCLYTGASHSIMSTIKGSSNV